MNSWPATPQITFFSPRLTTHRFHPLSRWAFFSTMASAENSQQFLRGTTLRTAEVLLPIPATSRGITPTLSPPIVITSPKSSDHKPYNSVFTHHSPNKTHTPPLTAS